MHEKMSIEEQVLRSNPILEAFGNVCHSEIVPLPLGISTGSLAYRRVESYSFRAAGENHPQRQLLSLREVHRHRVAYLLETPLVDCAVLASSRFKDANSHREPERTCLCAKVRFVWQVAKREDFELSFGEESHCS